MTFETLDPADGKTEVAPDGSEVHKLLTLEGGSMSRFKLASGEVSTAVRHRTVEEIWYVLAGAGRMWRSAATTAEAGRLGQHDQSGEITELVPGLCLTIPAGTAFQFQATRDLQIIGVTMPPWPGDGEASPVMGPWHPTRGTGID